MVHLMQRRADWKKVKVHLKQRKMLEDGVVVPLQLVVEKLDW